MKTFNLRILFPSSNKYKTGKSYTESIYATNVRYHDTHLEFWDNESQCVIASYPSQYTIIESIEDDDMDTN